MRRTAFWSSISFWVSGYEEHKSSDSPSLNAGLRGIRRAMEPDGISFRVSVIALIGVSCWIWHRKKRPQKRKKRPIMLIDFLAEAERHQECPPERPSISMHVGGFRAILKDDDGALLGGVAFMIGPGTGSKIPRSDIPSWVVFFFRTCSRFIRRRSFTLPR